MTITRNCILIVFLIAFMFSAAGVANAGPYTDAFGMCLVRSTSPDDKTLLVKWMFATMSLHPEVQSMVSISYEQRESLNEQTADMFMQLITDSCKDEAANALRYEGSAAFEGAFSVLGQVATRELFTDKSVSEGMEDFGKYFNEDKIKEALAEDQDAGEPPSQE